MSARYSNTSSRGRSIVMVSSTGSTAPGVLPDAARTDADGPLVLRRAHELAALRGVRGGAAGTARRRSPARRGRPARRPAACGGSARSGAVRRSAARRSCAAAPARSGPAGRRKAWFREFRRGATKPFRTGHPVTTPLTVPYHSPWRSGRWNGACGAPEERLMDPRTPSEVEATGTLPFTGDGLGSAHRRRARGACRRAARLGRRGPLGPDRSRQVPGLRGRRPARRGARLARVDADRPLAVGRHPLRRRDRVPPSCAGGQPGRRRTRARRPLAQRRLRQRRARRLGAAEPTATRSPSAATPSTTSTPPPSARAPHAPAAVAE